MTGRPLAALNSTRPQENGKANDKLEAELQSLLEGLLVGCLMPQ